MNKLLQNVIRFSTTTPMRVKPFQRVPYSTATDVTVLSESEEPDKLYKMIEIELRAPEPEAMRSYCQFAKMAADNLGIMVGRCWTPTLKYAVTNRQQLTLLRSAFAKKDYRTQYEIRTYFRYMTFHHLTGSTADTFLEYIERNLPESVAMKITKVSVEKLPEEITNNLKSDDIIETESSKQE